MRLKKESLSVTVCGKNIYEITSMPICDLNEFLTEYGAYRTAAADRKAGIKGDPGQGWIP